MQQYFLKIGAYLSRQSSSFLKKISTEAFPFSFRVSLAVYLGISLLFLVRYQVKKTGAGVFDLFEIGDWLINYRGGFVRRGLAGEVFLYVSTWTGFSLPVIVVLFKVFILVFLVAGIGEYVLRHPRFSVLHAVVLMSPAALSFPLDNHSGSGRKEILLLLFCWLFVGRMPVRLIGVWSMGMLLGGLILVHEGLFFFIPLLLVVLGAAEPTGFLSRRTTTALLLPPFIVFVLVNMAPPPAVFEICYAIDSVYPERWCQGGGSIDFLVRSANYGLQFTLSMANAMSVLSLMFGLLCVALPAWCLAQRFYDKRRFAVAVVLAMAIQIPLFLVGADWGRWIYISAFLLTLAAIRLEPLTPALQLATPKRAAFVVSLVTVLLCLIDLPVCCSQGVVLHGVSKGHKGELPVIQEYPLPDFLRMMIDRHIPA